jgi:hypothetical protein
MEGSNGISERGSENTPLQDVVSEPVSEKPPRRGRPARFDPGFLARVRSFAPDIRTPRGLYNRACVIKALSALMDDPAFHWLIPTDEEVNRNERTLPFAILTELGKIDDREAMKAVAAQVCERKLDTKAAVALIRRWRTGQGKPPGDAKQLTDALVRCINDYLASHSGMTWEMVKEAVTVVKWAAAESAREQADAEAG